MGSILAQKRLQGAQPDNGMRSTFPNCGRLVLGGVLGFIDADRCDQILIFQDLSRSTRFAYLEPALPKILFGDSVGKLALCVNVLGPNR